MTSSSVQSSPVEENTLGTVLSGAHAGRRVRTTKSVGIRPGTVGTDYLGTGTAAIWAIATIFGLVQFSFQWEQHMDPILTLVAWGLLITLMVAMRSVVRSNGSHLPDWMFAALLVGLAVVVALDLIAILPLGDVANYATASLTVGAALLALVTLRRAREVLIAAGVLGLTIAVAILFDGPRNPALLAPEISAVARAVFPPILGVVVVSSFHRMIQVELDRVLVQSTVSAPRFAVGMLASEELARLDLAAEQLLDGIAKGTTPLPLSPQTASTAASLATELRLHLIEGRRETWLYHAITESEFLGPSVHLSDPSSLAGLLDRRQRDGLLSATWLLLTSTTRPVVTVQLTLGPVGVVGNAAPMRKIMVPICILTTGVRRNRIDPSTWEAINKIGPHVVQVTEGSVRLDIDCVVNNPADQ